MTQSNISKKKISSELTINKGVELILGEKQNKNRINHRKSNLKKLFLYLKEKFILTLNLIFE